VAEITPHGVAYNGAAGIRSGQESRRLVLDIEDTRQLSEVAKQRKTAGGLARRVIGINFCIL